jgi:integrase
MIGCYRLRYATLLQLLKESASRIGEALTLRVTDFDLDRRIVTINNPEKGSRPRQVRMSSKFTGMVAQLIRGERLNDRVWELSLKTTTRSFAKTRRSAVKKLANPLLGKIHFHTFRHWKAAMEYHRTKDLLYVKRFLGHRSLNSTLVYTHLVDWMDD